MTRFALVAFWAVLSAGSARASAASDLTVEWQVPTQVCPDRESLRMGVSRRLGREVRFGQDAPLPLTGRVERDGAGYVLALHTRSQYGVEERSLRARTCNELARASVLIASLLFGREPATTERLDAHAQAPASERVPHLYARAQLAFDLGTLPGLGFGPSLMFGARFGAVAFELGGFALLPRSAAGPGPSEAALQLTAAVAAGCVTALRTRTVSASPCLHLEAGALHAEARQTSKGAGCMGCASPTHSRASTPRIFTVPVASVGHVVDAAGSRGSLGLPGAGLPAASGGGAIGS